MPALEKVANRIARPLKVLVPLIQAEIDAGHHAGLEHYRRAGEMLIEAKDQQPYGSWGKWIAKNFKRADGTPLSRMTAHYYMQLAERAEKEGAEVVNRRFTSVRSAIGRVDDQARAHKSWGPVHKAARELDAELYAQERQTQDDEVRLHRELAAELVDLGYRALATRLHPDRGGSKDAMRRLNTVREQLKSVAETRRFV
jgi:hypothetical protein